MGSYLNPTNKKYFESINSQIYVDICLIPRKLFADKPAIIIELKKDLSAEGAIAQIKNKQYIKALEDYRGNLMLCGINYDSKTKKHTCQIEGIVY